MASEHTAGLGDRIEIVDGAGEWYVRVTESGKTRTQAFEMETFATAFAEGQRQRLGLEQIVRI